jgi:hypothetical protein
MRVSQSASNRAFQGVDSPQPHFQHRLSFNDCRSHGGLPILILDFDLHAQI